MKHNVFLCLAMMTAACASAPVAPPTLKAGVQYGINDAFHGPLPAPILTHYCDYGGDLIVRTPQVSRDGFGALAQALSSACAGRALHMLALIEAPDPSLAAAAASLGPWAIENGNELELPPYNLAPQQYANAQASMLRAEGTAGFMGDIIMGGVYALTDATKQAIDLALPYCRLAAHCMVGVHLYDISDDDVRYLNQLDADIAITETGSPTGCGTEKWQQQADYVASARLKALEIRRLKYFIVYQRPSGRSCSNFDTFGLEADGTWKPLDTLLALWTR